MTPKKILSTIRGWFPKEPYLISTRVKMDTENKQPPTIIPSGYTVSATKVAGAIAVFWIILYGLLFSSILNFKSYPISMMQIAAWTIAGLALGTISCAIATENQLNRVSKDYRFSANGKEIILLIAPFVLVYGIGFFAGLSIPSAIMQTSFMQGLIVSLYVYGVSLVVLRPILFYTFERKENMRLIQSWWGTEIYLVPKPPQGQPSKRGELLNFFLIAGIVGCILAVLGYIAIGLVLLSNSTGLGEVLSGLSIPLWTLTFYPILAIVNVLAFAALYRWRKWGFYVLLSSSLAAFSVNLAVLGIRLEFVAGLFGIVILYLLLRPKWSLLQSGWPNIRKSLPLLLAILGIILLISSFTLTSHVEDRLRSVPQGASIASDRFDTNQPKPDTEIQANLTSQEKLHFEIIVVRTYPHQNVGSSVKFTISNQSLSSTGPTNVYFTNDKIGLPDDYYMFWSPPKNGTYYFTLNYNLSSGNVISYDITEGWNVNDPVQVVVYTPVLNQFMAPMLILAAAVLTVGAAKPIRRILKKNQPQFDKA